MYIEPLKVKLEAVFMDMNKGNSKSAILIKSQLKEIDTNIETLEKWFVFGKIDEEIYLKYLKESKDERRTI